MWNPYKHLRLAGGLTCLVAALIHNFALVFIGLFIQYIGVIGGLDRLERLFDEKFPEEKKDE